MKNASILSVKNFYLIIRQTLIKLNKRSIYRSLIIHYLEEIEGAKALTVSHEPLHFSINDPGTTNDNKWQTLPRFPATNPPSFSPPP